MNEQFIITEQELRERALNLCNLTIEDTDNQAIIYIALDRVVTACCDYNDSFSCEEDIERDLTKNPSKVSSFKKLQRAVIYNLLYTPDEPVDEYCYKIISQELKWGKINGFQKGIFVKR